MFKKKLEIITCPICGREYLPAEIFYPNSFLGKPKDIDKDFDGKIINFNGKSIDSNETYVCDGCGTVLKVTARVQFRVDADLVHTMNKPFTVDINSNDLELNEE